jgi:hypothetical protein
VQVSNNQNERKLNYETKDNIYYFACNDMTISRTLTPLHTEVSADAVRGVEQLRLMRLEYRQVLLV